MDYLKVDNINKSYGKNIILGDILFNVKKGEFVSILGESGSGKTTLLKIIAGLLPHDSGKLYLEGSDISNVEPRKRDIAMVFQEYLLFPHLNILENVEFSLKVRGMDKAERRKKAAYYMEMVQLKGMENRYPHELSGGQKQRVAVARAIVSEPKLLLLDEPFSSLDANLRSEMCDFIKSVQRETNLTTVMVTHDRVEAMKISDRIAIIKDGRILQYDTPFEIYKRPNCLFSAKFMGEANIIKGIIKDGEFYSPSGFKTSIDRADGEGCLIVRPEDIIIRDCYKDNLIKGLVMDRTFSGDRVYYSINVDNNLLKVSVPGSTSICENQQNVYLEISEEGIIKTAQ